MLLLACEIKQPCMESLAKVDNALDLIFVFKEAIAKPSNVQQAILNAMSSSSVSEAFYQFTTHIPTRSKNSQNHNAAEWCPSAYSQARTQLHQELAVMILSSGLHSSKRDGPFEPSLMSVLLEKQTKLLDAGSTGCVQRKPSLVTAKISLFEAGSTPQAESVSHNWRDSLNREISRDVRPFSKTLLLGRYHLLSHETCFESQASNLDSFYSCLMGQFCGLRRQC